MATKKATSTAPKGSSAKTATKKSTVNKAPARTTPAKKGPAKTAPAKKTPAKKTPAKKTAAKVSAKKTPATSSSAKKAPAKKAATPASTGRKYSPAASKQVGQELHEMHRGQLRIGNSNKKVTNPKQAIAIGLSEARRAGKKVPPNPNTPNKK